MSSKTVSQVLMVGGVVLLVISLGADLIGIGTYPGINWAQFLGTALGLALFGYGFWTKKAKTKDKK